MILYAENDDFRLSWPFSTPLRSLSWRVTGSIPDTLSTLTSLQHLYVHCSSCTEALLMWVDVGLSLHFLPPSVYTSYDRSLQQILLPCWHGAMLSVSICSSHQLYSMLKMMLLGYRAPCRRLESYGFTGSFPSTLSSLVNLQYLYVLCSSCPEALLIWACAHLLCTFLPPSVEMTNERIWISFYVYGVVFVCWVSLYLPAIHVILRRGWCSRIAVTFITLAGDCKAITTASLEISQTLYLHLPALHICTCNVAHALRQLLCEWVVLARYIGALHFVATVCWLDNNMPLRQLLCS